MHKIFVDLGYGDSGKGVSVARTIAQEPTASIVKFSGGAQAAHNVVWGNNHHTFAQIGSGGFIEGVRTMLSADFLLDVDALHREAESLRRKVGFDPLNYVYISGTCLVITKAMVAANHDLERANRHGSTGRGIGTTVGYDIETGNGVRAEDLRNLDTLKSKLRSQRAWLFQYFGIELPDTFLDEASSLYAAAINLNILPESQIYDMLHDTSSSLVFEGSQGVLLDQHVGWFPHVTRANTTSVNAKRLLDGEPAITYGVMRTYMTRHGAGPFPTEIDWDDDGDHNQHYVWAGHFKRGYLDVEAIRYALRCQPVELLSVTHCDINLPVAFSQPYEHHWSLRDRAAYTETLFDRELKLGPLPAINNIENWFGVEVGMAGYGPELDNWREL